MKIVPDTNIIVSGLLWKGAPYNVLTLAQTGEITLYTSPALLAELRDVLDRPKFVARLKKVETTSRKLSLEFAALTKLIHPKPIEPVILADPDDDAVLACAISANAQVITSGDSHLLELKSYRGISIFSVREFLDWFTKHNDTIGDFHQDRQINQPHQKA
jgi:putative PIN family toxin of toxin-antitoxin system